MKRKHQNSDEKPTATDVKSPSAKSAEATSGESAPSANRDEKKSHEPDGESGSREESQSPESAPHGEIADLLKKLDEVSAELSDYRARFLRSVADFENYRRRMTREKEEVRQRATAGVIEDLLPVFDTLALGLESARKHHPEARAVLDGIEMVQTQARQVLEQHGLERLEPLGVPFDPNYHEAVSHQSREDFEDGVVCEVVRPGYMMRERLLRPATVIVSSGSTKETNAEKDTDPESPAAAESRSSQEDR